MNGRWTLTLFWLTIFTGVLNFAGNGAEMVGLARLLVMVFFTLAVIALALHEGRQSLA